MVLFVGDKPSSKNIDPTVAFKGTKSYNTLCEWARKLGLESFMTTNSHTPELLKFIKANHKLRIVVALGKEAGKRLDSIGVPHIKMPHPSGRNRKLNDKEYVEDMLWDVKRRIELLRPVLLHSQEP